MKNIILLLLFLLAPQSYAATLADVYQQALISDPLYQQAISSRLSTQEGLPISFAGLLPTLTAQVNPYLNKQSISGASATFEAGSITTRGYVVGLNVNQTVFDFGKVANLLGARALSKQADAALSAATQDLMVRVAKAYFTILQDEETLLYSKANQVWLTKLLDQVKQQYQVGLKTLTDVYATQAKYDSAVAQYITADNQVKNDKENLRVITGKWYDHINMLSEKFPFITPDPTDIDAWVQKAQQQNWAVKAEQYAVSNRLQQIRQQFAGHLPSLEASAGYTNNYAFNSQALFIENAPLRVNGITRTVNKNVNLTLNIPLFQGGGTAAEVQKAKYDYQTEMQALEQTLRNTINTTRQSYLNILASISKISADRQAIKSAQSALEGMDEGYRVGTKTIIDVLQQQQSLFDAQKIYALDRYDYITNLLILKQAAGTLSGADLEAINQWLQK